MFYQGAAPEARGSIVVTVQWTPERVGRYSRAAFRWARLLTSRRPAPGLRVSYGHDRVPAAGEPVAGGSAKFQKLAARFPNHPADFTLLYLGSTWLPRDAGPLLRYSSRRAPPCRAQPERRRLPGLGRRAHRRDQPSAAPGPRRGGPRPLPERVLQAGRRRRSSVSRAARGRCSTTPSTSSASDPPARPPAAGPVLLLGGDQTQAYRLELGLRTLAALLPTSPDARLLVTGRLVVPAAQLVEELGVRDHVVFTGRYAQRDAPELFRRAHLLLHTKVNDPCPTLVIEAMASGLPVVYPASGGTVELVGDEAGIGVAHDDSFAHDRPPSPEAMAAAVERVLSDRRRYAESARARAVERFALEPWLDRHAELFASLTASA